MATATRTAGRIESLLSARLFLNPQLAGDRLYFVSDLSGRLSLYAMDVGGSVPRAAPAAADRAPEPRARRRRAVRRPARATTGSCSCSTQDGDENYQPHVIPLAGGFPEPLNDEFFGGLRSHMTTVDDDTATGYFFAESREQALIYGVRADLATGEATMLGEGPYGPFPFTWTKDHARVVPRRRLHGRRRRPLRDATATDEANALGHAARGARGGRRAPAVRASARSHFTDSRAGPARLDDAVRGHGRRRATSTSRRAGRGRTGRDRGDRRTRAWASSSGPGKVEGDRFVADLQHRRLLVGLRGDASTRARQTLRIDRVLCGEGELEGGVIHGIDVRRRLRAGTRSRSAPRRRRRSCT